MNDNNPSDSDILDWLEETRADVLRDSEPGGEVEVCVDTWTLADGYNHYKSPRGRGKSLRDAVLDAMGKEA